MTNDEELTSRFGRVAHADTVNGPYIRRNGVRVDRILELVDCGLNYNQVCQQIKGLEIKDVMASLAYRVRFLGDKVSPLPAPRTDTAKERPYFLLDENISYLLLPKIYKIFGASSSVMAEGLYFQRNSDEHDVWKFAVDHEYRAILTQDSDFRGIAKRARSALLDEFKLATLPKVIMIPHGMDIKSVEKLLQAQADAIRNVVDSHEPFATWKVYPTEVRGMDGEQPRLVAA